MSSIHGLRLHVQDLLGKDWYKIVCFISFSYENTRQKKKKNFCQAICLGFSFGKYDHYNYQLQNIKLNTVFPEGLQTESGNILEKYYFRFSRTNEPSGSSSGLSPLYWVLWKKLWVAGVEILKHFLSVSSLTGM